MAIVLIRQILDLSKINIDHVQRYYPKDIRQNSKIFFIISRVFNDSLGQIEIRFDIPFTREVIQEKKATIGGYPEDVYFLKIDDIIDNYHIARGYYLEIIIRYASHDGKIKTIFPGEIRYNGHERVVNYPEEIINAIITNLEPHEISTTLASLNYTEIAGDLTQSIKRFDTGDCDGSIKFSRKVVEGIKQLKIEDFVEESNRQDKLKSYMASSFSLLSNFGEHTGTSASDEEALLAKEIALGLSRYLVAKHSN